MIDPILDKTKTGDWLLRRLENIVRPTLASWVPSWMQTYHLTLFALVWTLGVMLSAYLAQTNIQWLWLSAFCILAHYVTDFLDGTIGRIRNTGLVKWGYYTDHFLDYIFFTSLILSYIFVFPPSAHLFFVILAFIQIGFMINIFLVFGTKGELQISFAGFGPSETRIAYVLFNIFIIFFGTALPILLLPYLIAASALLLLINVYHSQKTLWRLDMQIKSESPSSIEKSE